MWLALSKSDTTEFPLVCKCMLPAKTDAVLKADGDHII